MFHPTEFSTELQPAARLIKSGRMAEARQRLRPILQADPKNADGWYLVSLTTNQHEQKAKALERALKFNPHHALARTALGELDAIDDLLADAAQGVPAKAGADSTRESKWYANWGQWLRYGLFGLIGIGILVAALFPKSDMSGKLAYVVRDWDWNGEIYFMSSMGGESVNLTGGQKGHSYDPMFSPDGSRIAFISDRDGDFELYTMNLDGSDVQRLTRSAAAEEDLAWSPDGRQIAYSLESGNRYLIYVINVDGTGERQVTPPGDGSPHAMDLSPDWSPDGQQIVFSSNRRASWQLFLINADGTNLRSLTDAYGNHQHPSWSPDGKHIVYSHNVSGLDDALYVMDANGSNHHKLADGFKDPVWIADGQWILCTAQPDGEHTLQIYLIQADGSHPRRVTSMADSSATDPAWTP